jgi:signal transduction histidine kinase
MDADAAFWAEKTADLVDLSHTEAPDTNFFPKFLRILKDGLGAKAVFYVRHDFHRGDDLGYFFVAGDSVLPKHVGKDDCDEIHPALREVLTEAFSNGNGSRFGFEVQSEADLSVVRVLKVTFQELKTRNLLLIVGDDSGPSPGPTEVDREAAFRFLVLLSHVHNSFDRAQLQTLRDERRDVMREINSARGSVGEVAAKLCETWQQLVGAGAVRLWLYNHHLEELDLLREHAEPGIRKLLEQTSNRLPFASLAGKALRAETTHRSTSPADDVDWWADDPHVGAVLAVLPHLISVPLLLPGREGWNPSHVDGPRLGVVDLLMANAATVRQPDHRLDFLGELTALALDRAHLTERRRVLVRLTDIELSLINPTSDRSLGDLRYKYLQDLIVVIKESLNAEGVAIFEANDARDEIRCCKSTGLEGKRDGSYKRVKDEDVSYRKGEGTTWTVFESGKPCLERDVTKLADYRGKYREVRKIPPGDNHDPFLAVPLLGRNNEPVGVIRVLQRKCHAHPDRLQNFSSHDLDVLQLIASQVSPILQMLRHALHRARLMVMVDHDVIQPLQAIVACSKNLIRGRYPYDFDEGVRDRLTYMLANAWTATRRIQERASAKETDSSAAARDAQPRTRFPSVAKFFIERNIDVEPLRRAEGVKVRLVNEREADAMGPFEAPEMAFIQAVGNVMHNAVKYSYPNTLVEVRVRREGTRLTADVTSTGLPIDPTERNRIFDDWARGLAAVKHDTIEGTGQGLFITRQLMRGMGGDVVLVPGAPSPNVRPPAGFPPAEQVTFRLTLPGAFR